jgi:hypothetical protein
LNLQVRGEKLLLLPSLGVLSAEALHPASGVHKLLLASKEGMAIGANFYVDVALVGRTSGKAVTARAHDADFVVSGMNGCFHELLTSVPNFSGNYSILKEGRRIQQMEPHRLASSSPLAKSQWTERVEDPLPHSLHPAKMKNGRADPLPYSIWN